MANNKYYISARWTPRRARSKKLREAGLTSADVKKHVSGAVSGDISALWQESESIRRYYEISYSALDASISNINNGMTVIQNKQQTLTEAEVEGMVNNILQ